MQQQLDEAQAKITSITAQLKHQSTSSTSSNSNSSSSATADLGDDLARVLISKEEVITHLERQLYDKEKHIQQLSKQLNDEIAAANKYQDAFGLELARNGQIGDHYAERLAKCSAALAQHEITINQLHNEKSKCEIELKSIQEYSRNELESLQEEVKTLEYKLVFSQRQAQEYQAILEDMDCANANALVCLGQVYAAAGGNPNVVAGEQLSTSASLHARLTRNQAAVTLLMQHVLEQRGGVADEARQRLAQLQSELDECKEENVELNDHIYAIDVYMREKETEAERLLKEKEELEAEVGDLRFRLGPKGSANKVENIRDLG